MGRVSRVICLFVVGLVGTAGAVGCGGAGDGPPDGPEVPGDGEVPAGMVRATVRGPEGVADATARLVFLAADGTLIADAAVDEMGRGQARVPDGGSVTAVRITGDAQRVTANLHTTIGVASGDDLTLGFLPPATAPDRSAPTTMVANFVPLENAIRYVFYIACGATTVVEPPVTLTFRDGCRGEQFDLLAVASGSQLDVPHFLAAGEVPFQNGGAVDLRAPFKEMASFLVHLTNVPAEVSGVGVTRASMIGNAPVASQTVVSGDPPAGDVALAVPFAPEVGTRSEVSISMDRAGAQSRQAHEIHTATVGTGVDVDLAAQRLPWFADVVQTPTGGTWAMVADGGAADGMLTEWTARWSDGGREVTLIWRIVQPAGAASLAGMTLPVLPAAYAMVDPRKHAAVTLETMRVTFADYDGVAGYDQLRPSAETLLLQPIGTMGAFVGMPLQRRVSTMSAF